MKNLKQHIKEVNPPGDEEEYHKRVATVDAKFKIGYGKGKRSISDLSSSELKKYLDNKNVITVKNLNIDSDTSTVRFDFFQNPSFDGKFNVLVEKIIKWQKESCKVILIASTQGQVKRIHELLNDGREKRCF